MSSSIGLQYSGFVFVAVFDLVDRIFLEALDMLESHSFACTWSAIAILLAVRGSCLKVSSSGGSSLNETSWATSARVLTRKVLVRLMTMGIILTSAFSVLCVCSASISGS